MARRKPLAKKSVVGTRKSVLNKRRKGFLAVFIPWVQRFGIGLALVVAVIWTSTWLWLSGSFERAGDWSQNQIQLAAADMGFEVRNILVEGRVHTDADVILAVLNIQEGDPLFSFDPKAAQNQLEKIGWVKTAQVQRRFPDTLYISLEERQPTAVLKDGAAFKLLDRKGKVIPTASMKPFKDLLIVQGKGAQEKASDLTDILNAEPVIQERALAATYLGERRWDLALKGGIKIQLPEEDLGLALRKLADAHKESGLLDKSIQAVDVREADRISIRTKPGQVSEYKASLKVNAGNPI